jgi:hypothetical protein
MAIGIAGDEMVPMRIRFVVVASAASAVQHSIVAHAVGGIRHEVVGDAGGVPAGRLRVVPQLAELIPASYCPSK